MSLGLLTRFGMTRNGAGAPFAPDDIAGLELWLDASDASTITDTGGAVSAWNDKSGNAYHVTQGTGSVQPSTGASTIGGENAITFALGDSLANASSVVTGSTSRTVFVVTQNAGGDAFGSPVSLGTIVTPTSRHCFSCTREMAIRVDGGNEIYTTALGTGASIAVYGLNGTQVQDAFARLNGTALTVSSTSTPTGVLNTQASVTIGVGLSSGSYRYTGDVGEVLVYSSALSAGDIDDVEAYLAAKWGVTL